MITDEMIRHAKSLELPDLMRRRNIELFSTNGGSAFKCLCPFHEDKDPSLNLNIKDGLWLWNCFGCGSGGTNIDFIMKFENKDFKDTVQMLSRDRDSEIGRIKIENIKSEIDSSEVAPLQNDKKSRSELFSMVVDHYHKILTGTENKGKAYLQKRCLLDDGLIDAFKIGFSNGSANEALKDCRLQLREELGIFKDNYYETFANCVIFPVLDLDGNPTDIYARRTMNYTDRANHCYNKGKHQGIFNIANVKDAETIILTEGIIDALSIYKAGFKNVTALYGTQGFTRAHEELFNNGTVKEIIFALDNDNAGRKAVQKLSERLKNLQIKQVIFPEGIKDANELLVKQSLEALQNLINNASSFTPVDPLPENLEKVRVAIAKEQKPVEIIDTLVDLKFPKFTFNGLDLVFNSTVLNYEIRNVGKLKNLDSMRFIIKAFKDNLEHADRIDLYLSRSRKIFENETAKQFNLQTAVIERDLTAIRSFIESDFKRRKIEGCKDDSKIVQLTEAETAEALEFLKLKNLIQKIIDDLAALGYVGEDDSKLLLYLGATSRKLTKPISILIRSQSSSGKSFLIKLICSLLPAEDVHTWTAATKQAFYYMAPDALKHKFIAIDEKHGIEESEYPIRSLQSEGVLSLAVPVKNPTTGVTTTEEIVKEGPIAYVDGSTDTRVNPENANRCFEIYLDESEIQTKLVQGQQKKAHSLEGLAAKEQLETIKRIHRNAQRLLKPVKVIIPYVELIDFPTEWIRTRRDHDRFLNLIVSVAFLHQYQREIKEFTGKGSKPVQYIEASVKDYAIAYRIAKTVLFNTFQELEKPVFDFYLKLLEMVEAEAKKQGIELEEFTFTRRNIRQVIKLPDYLVKRFMRVLKDLEYFEVRNNGQGSKDVYRLIVHTKKTDFLYGLTTPSQLKAKMDK